MIYSLNLNSNSEVLSLMPALVWMVPVKNFVSMTNPNRIMKCGMEQGMEERYYHLHHTLDHDISLIYKMYVCFNSVSPYGKTKFSYIMYQLIPCSGILPRVHNK